MFYTTIGLCSKDFKTGLSNQIFSLVYCLLIAKSYNHKVMVVDHFLDDFEKGGWTPISEVINLHKINVFLKNKYDIIIIDKNKNIQFSINYIKYGNREINVDITQELLQTYLNNDSFVIPKDINFNSIKGDPVPYTKKQLFFNYTINNYIVEEVYEEKLKDHISIDFLRSYYHHQFINTNIIKTAVFIDILSNINIDIYNSTFVEKSNLIYKHIDMNKKINVIHLRLEEDGISYWANANNMSQEDYKQMLEQKYIDLIKKCINKGDQNIIVSQSLNNKVIDFLQNNNYIYRFSEKFFEGREKNAIVDLLISSNCNNVFIGNYTFKHFLGSTFSYYIAKLLKKDVKGVYIDIEHIHEEAEVVMSVV